jgi:hypothetical protein
MPVSLAFDAAHHYTEALDGIEVPITLCIDREAIGRALGKTGYRWRTLHL